MTQSTRDGRRGRRNSKNLDGGQTIYPIVDTELTEGVAANRPDRPVWQKDDGDVASTCNGRRC